MPMPPAPVLVVTGAYGQLGAVVCRHLLDAGAQLARLDLQVPNGRPDGPGEMSVALDLTQRTTVDAALRAVAQRFGRIDGLVNLAGGFQWQRVQDSSLDEWGAMFRMNLLTCVTVSRAVLPHLLAQGQGRIVNIGAMGGQKGVTGMGAYAASKAGVARFTEALADEVKDQGITVNAVLPGTLDTPRNRADMPDADTTRWVTPQQIAGVIAFLLSDAADAVTGALLPVTGRG